MRDFTQRHLDSTPDPQAFLDRWGISRKDTRRIRIVRDGMNVEHLVERRFLEPELHSLMEVKRAVVRRGDVGRMVVNAPVSAGAAKAYPPGRLRRIRRGPGLAHRIDHRQPRPRPSLVRPGTDVRRAERADMSSGPMAQQYRHVDPD